jgi:glycosyltransferase involved in cell wall biosynthesis
VSGARRPAIRTGFGACAVIPAHGEERTVAAVVRGALEIVDDVIVVDDGSRDETLAEAKNAGARVVRWPERRGKGAALRAGLERAFALGFGTAVTLDADGQHLPREIQRLLDAHSRGAQLVVGDRSAEFRRMSAARRWTNRVMTALLRPFAGASLNDSQCGFRLISARLYGALDLRCEGFDFESGSSSPRARRQAASRRVPVSCVAAAGDRSRAVDGLRFPLAPRPRSAGEIRTDPGFQ